jgi:hypothetical protein
MAKEDRAPRVPRADAGKAHRRRSRIAPPQPQHPHRQIELRDSASGIQQFEANPWQHVEDDADLENKMSLLRRIDLSKS